MFHAFLLKRLGPALLTGLWLSSPSALAGGARAAMLLPGGINDQSWNQDGYAGLIRIKQLGFEVAYSENVSVADHVEALRDYARQGYNLIIGHSGRFLSAEQRVGPSFPAVQFITGAGSAGSGKNVLSIDFNNRHFGCLLGVLAAGMTKSGKIAGVYGLEGLPTTVDQAGSFRVCAQKAHPAIEVTLLYVMDMEDASSAREAAFSVIAAGADVVVGQLNAGHVGLLQAAKERNVFVTGRSAAHTAIAPRQVLTNVIEKWPEMYAAVARDVAAGKISAGYRVYGLDTAASSGAELRYSAEQAYNEKVPSALIADMDLWSKRLAQGALVVVPTREDAHGGR